MRLPIPVLALALTLGAACATERSVPPVSVANAELGIFRAAELARVRCLVVAPLENSSSAPLAAEAATSTLLSGVAASGARVLPVKELRALFRETPVELPEGIPPGLAMELAQLVGADAAIYGTVEGSAGSGPGLVVSVRLALSPGRELLYATTFGVRARGGETVEQAVRRGLADATHDLFLRLGGARGGTCFERKRLDSLRAFAQAEALACRAAASPSAPPAPCPTVAPPTAPVAAPAPPPAAPPAAPRTVATTQRQRDFARQLVELDSFIVDDVSFVGRTSRLQRDGGLADLAIALLATPGARVRIEGHVDATLDSGADARLSLAMAQATVDRLRELGVPAGRIQLAGRGAENPRLPNFTARGRSANRRIEAVGLK